jgi:hypothetical protein
MIKSFAAIVVLLLDDSSTAAERIVKDKVHRKPLSRAAPARSPADIAIRGLVSLDRLLGVGTL